MTTFDPIADELAVRRTTAAYTDAMNRMDFPTAVSTYVPDGVLVMLSRPPFEGRVAILAFLEAVTDRYSLLTQMVHSGLVDIDGDVAHARWQVTELQLVKDGDPVFIAGRYEDELHRTDEGWRFAHRAFVGRYYGATDFRAPVLPDQPVRFTFPF